MDEFVVGTAMGSSRKGVSVVLGDRLEVVKLLDCQQDIVQTSVAKEVRRPLRHTAL